MKIDKIKNYIRNYKNNIKSVDDYIDEIKYGSYKPLTNKMFSHIKDEGWVDELNNYFHDEYKFDDFDFLKLDLSSSDHNGLINLNISTVNKFNLLDIRLKEMGHYPYTVLDFIDYDNGVVYIIRLKKF